MTSSALDSIDHYLVQEDVHDLLRQKQTNVGVVCIASVLLTFLHGLNIYALLWGHTTFMWFVLAHGVLVLLTYVFAQASLRTEGRFSFILTLTTAATGVFGAAGVFFGCIFFLLFERYALNFRQWFESIFPSHTPSLPEVIYDDLLTGRDESSKRYSVIPFMDVMVIGSEEQKREALSRMTSNFNPQFAPAFHKALSDEVNTIRVQAATSIVKIENQFLKRSMIVEKLYRQHPKDSDVLLAMARHYDEYAYTGILDPEREESNRGKALDAYMLYLKGHPADVRVRLFVGRLLLRSGKFAEAAEWFRQSIDAGYSAPQMVTWYMECLFQQGLYQELREFTQRFHLSADQALPPQLVEVIPVWSGHATLEAA